MALSRRFATRRVSRSGAPRTSHGSIRSAKTTCGASRRARSRPARTTSSSRTSWKSAAVSPRRLRSTTSATRFVSSSVCVTRSRSRSARSPGGRPSARCSTSMFVRRLASGVRSSCDASATSWRCASTDRSSASRVVLNDRVRRPSSSSAPLSGSRAATSASPGDPLRPLRERPHRPQRPPGDEPPERRPRHHPARRDEQQHHAEPVEERIRLVQPARELRRHAGGHLRRQHPQVGAVHRLVGEERAARAGRDLPRPRVHLQRHPAHRRLRRGPVRPHQLRVHRRPPAAAPVRRSGRRSPRPAAPSRPGPARGGTSQRRNASGSRRRRRRRASRAPPRGPRRARRRSPGAGGGSVLAEHVADAADRLDQA